MEKLFYIITFFFINYIICQEDEHMNYIIDNIYLGDVEAANDEE